MKITKILFIAYNTAQRYNRRSHKKSENDDELNERINALKD